MRGEERSRSTDHSVLHVNCYAGYRGEQTPRAFLLQNDSYRVDEVLDSWLAPAHRYFKVLADDGRVYILRHDPGRDRWELTVRAARGYFDGP